MNRPISEPGWPEYSADGKEAREVWIRHVYGVYRIMETLRRRHPQLSIESCASGGSRADLGILRYTDQVWTSDNTHPDARLLIQEGTSYILPGRVMSDWVTDTPADRQVNEIPLRYRFHVAMLGMLGIGGHLSHWSTADLQEAARWIDVYKKIRPLIQDGEQDWLIAPSEHNGEIGIVEYRSRERDRAVVIALRKSNPFWESLPPLRLQGLEADGIYSVRQLGEEGAGKGGAGKGGAHNSERSGAFLMGHGLELPLGDSSYESYVIELKRVR